MKSAIFSLAAFVNLFDLEVEALDRASERIIHVARYLAGQP